MQEEISLAIEYLLHPCKERMRYENLEPGLKALSLASSEQIAHDFILQWSFLQDIPAEVCIKDVDSKMIWGNRLLLTKAGEKKFYDARPAALWGAENGTWLKQMDLLALVANRTLCHAELLNPAKKVSIANDAEPETFDMSFRVPLSGVDRNDSYIGVLGLSLKTLREVVTAASTLQKIAFEMDAPEKTSPPAKKHDPPTERLQRLAQLMDRFLAQLPVEICIKDEKSRLIWCNKRFTSLIEIPLAQLRNCELNQMWPAKRALRLRAMDEAVLAGQKLVYDDTITHIDRESKKCRRRHRVGIRFPISLREKTIVGSLGFDAISPWAAQSISKAIERDPTWTRSSRPEQWFISHNNFDQEVARKLKNDLEAEGHEVYASFDDPNLGEKLSDYLLERIDQCDRFVVILSEAALKSDWVNREIKYARETRGSEASFICPIHLEPGEKLQGFCPDGELLSLRAIRLYDWHDQACYNSAFRDLLNVLGAVKLN